MEIGNSSNMDVKPNSQTEKKCRSCGFVTFYLRVLYQHKYKCQGQLLGKPLKCGYCKRKFIHPFLLNNHKKTCTRKNEKRKIFSSKVKQKSKVIDNQPVVTKKEKIEPSTIVCPLCMKFFSSRTLYAAHEKSGTCQSKETFKKKSFSARKSLPTAPPKYKKKRKYIAHTSDSDSSFSSDNLLSDIVESNRWLRSSMSKGYKCVRCRNKYPAKVILLKHLELNYKCAIAHYEHFFYQKKSRKARKTLQPVVARKSFSYAKRKKFSNVSSKPFQKFQRTARKSLPNSSPKQTIKSHSNKQNSVKPANQCPVCYAVFPNSFSFYQHQKKVNHWGKATKSMSLNCKCPFCQKEFYSVRARNAHIKNHADESDKNIESFLKSTTCDICSQIFVSETLKLQHMKVEHSQKQKISLDTSLSSNSVENSSKNPSLPQAIKQLMKQYPYTCPICAKEFVATSLRNKHFEDSHLDSNIECIFCPIKCSSDEQLDNHMRKFHYDQFKHECLDCKIKLPSMSHVKLHVKKFHPSRDSKSDSYSQQSLKATGNENNLYKETQEKSQSFYCDICNLSFLKLQFLRRHEQSIQHRDTLVKHLDAVHESLSNLPPSPPPAQPKPIQMPDVLSCSECFEEFSQLKDFVPHRLSHFSKQNKYLEINEENTYKCEICGDVSDSHSKVQVHLFWHLQVESLSKDKKSDKEKNTPVVSAKSGSQHVAKKSFGKQTRETRQEVVIGGVKKHLFMCEACHIGFTNQTHYNMHVSRFCKMKTNPIQTKISTEVKKNYKMDEAEKNNLTDEVEKKDLAQEVDNNNIMNEVEKNDLIEVDKKKDFAQMVEKNDLVQVVEKNDLEQMVEKNDLVQEVKKNNICKVEKNNLTNDVEKNNLTNDVEKNNLTNGVEKNDVMNSTSALDSNTGKDVLEESKNIEIEQCDLCYCIFNKSIKLVHDEFCTKCHRINVDISCDVNDLKSSINQETAIAACLQCNSLFDSPQNLLDHMIVLHSVNPESSEVVNEISEVNEINEVPVVEGDLVLHCITCNMIFFSTDVLKDHEVNCNNFNYTNSRLENYTPEFKAALEQNCILSSCLTCDLAFNTTEDLSEHVASHQNNSVVSTIEQEKSITNDVNDLDKMDTTETFFANEETSVVSENSLIQNTEVVQESTNNQNPENITNVLPNSNNLSLADIVDNSITSDEMSTSSIQSKQLGTEIDNLRKNFSQLLSILVSDPDLMQQLGYGELTVDEVLINVLQTMEQTPILKDENTSDLDCLRKNIQLLLDFCLEDQVMALIGDGKTSTDDIVVEALKIFGGESSMSIVALE